MYRMEKITTGIAYGASGGGTGYWLLQLLDKVSPSQWAAIGVLGSLMFGDVEQSKAQRSSAGANRVRGFCSTHF